MHLHSSQNGFFICLNVATIYQVLAFFMLPFSEYRLSSKIFQTKRTL